ncbi:5' exonuclease Apollo [Tetrabaena socialis]|uniref:5' exonuclease Apollo n=1 Tax=Tetrabaena socialis TaxID=47790 RepID=A0A2J7ZWS4_9CHLO|nr:5' exonuclease Apollo [Tetrabaena socialis]|eukprot:PNH04714.1 5' exonuclease Apollo [Tetrabaena socialis]
MAVPQHPTTLLSCLPYVVDTWMAQSSSTGKPHFLTHCHKDHTGGIEDCCADIYATDLTRRLLLLRQPDAARRANRFHTLQLGRRTDVSYGTVRFWVTPLDAAHCPGAAMLLFQGCFGTVSGAGRSGTEVGEALGRGGGGGDADADGSGAEEEEGEEGCVLDLLYLDCTFADLPLDFPSREDAARHAEHAIRGWGAAGGCSGSGGNGSSQGGRLRRVFLACGLLVTEPLAELAGRAFGQPLYVCPPRQYREFGFANAGLVRQRREELALLLPHQPLSDDPACVFHLCGNHDVSDRRGNSTGLPTPHNLSRSSSSSCEGRRSGSSASGACEGGESSGGCRAAGSGGDLAVAQPPLQGHYSGACLSSQLLALRTAAPAPTTAAHEGAVAAVLFAAHSSRSELVAALAVLRPRAMRPIGRDMVGRVAAVVLEFGGGAEGAAQVEAEVAARMAWAKRAGAEAIEVAAARAGLPTARRALEHGAAEGAAAAALYPPLPLPRVATLAGMFALRGARPREGLESPGCPPDSHPAKLIDNRNCATAAARASTQWVLCPAPPLPMRQLAAHPGLPLGCTLHGAAAGAVAPQSQWAVRLKGCSLLAALLASSSDEEGG